MNEGEVLPREEDFMLHAEKSVISPAPVVASSLSTPAALTPQSTASAFAPERATVVSEGTLSSSAPESAPVTFSSSGVSEGDTWVNQDTAFRVDAVTPAGGVHIRFRTTDTLEGSSSSFIRKARALLEKKAALPQGEWFFGSGEEIQQFIEQNGYQLEKRKEEARKS